MKKYAFLTTLLLAFCGLAFAQTKTIRANSNLADIRDGKTFKQGNWRISPEAKPDVYITHAKGEKVTFYTDLDSITVRITPTTQFDFIILLHDSVKAHTQIKYEPSYLDKLQQARAFNPNERREIPKFTYQDAGDSNLVFLRTALKLDSIAGKGSEELKVLNLLRWIHNLIPHDGNHENPIVKNAMSMIRECRKEEKGLNCRGLATVLNECYLAMGFKSRFVTCMPKDSVFDDCHVINMVFLEEKQKWVWIDPTHNAYVMNEKGDLLGIEEVRERLISREPLLLNPDANWNNQSSTTKEYYLYNYMAKNLYRFQCPLRSGYNTETLLSDKQYTYVDLLPLDAYQQKPYKSTSSSQESGVTLTNYKTNNPALFWSKP